MGLSNSKNARTPLKYELIEWYMESENYVQLSMLISNNFNYLETIPMESPKNSTCSYLHLAAKFDSIFFVEMWLKNKYPINMTDYRGWSVLHWAIYYNSPHVFMKLLRVRMSLHDKIPLTFKKKNDKLRGKTALEMITLMGRTYLMKLYSNFLTSNLSIDNTPHYVSEEVYQRDYIPNAKQISKSYIFETLPHNYKNQTFQLIEKIDNWSVYSDKYGNLAWRNHITRTTHYIWPDCLRQIVTLSYFQDSNTFGTEHIRN